MRGFGKPKRVFFGPLLARTPAGEDQERPWIALKGLAKASLLVRMEHTLAIPTDYQVPRPFDKCHRKEDYCGALVFFERAKANAGLRGFSLPQRVKPAAHPDLNEHN